MSLGDYIAANIDCFLTQWVKGGKAVDGKKSGGGIKKEKTLTRNEGVMVCPPCFEPAVLAGLSWFVERWENSFQKNTDVFWKVWEPQYQEANNVIISANSPAILKKKCMEIIHHQKKRIGSLSYLYLPMAG